MQATVQQNSEAKPVCDLPLCGKPADWKVEMFGKVEYFCERHRPGVPEKFMAKVQAP